MLGLALLKECVDNDVCAIAIIRPNSFGKSKLPKSNLIKVIECDISNYKNYCPDESADCFYHLAWQGTSPQDRNNKSIQDANVQYTVDAVHLASRFHCKKFIGAGSQAEYGIQMKKIDAHSTPNPVSAYGHAKLIASEKCKTCCQSLNIICIWTRIFSVYGIHDRPDSLINYALRCAISGEKAVFSKALNKWDYLFESDAAAILLLLGKKIVNHSTFCLASGISKPLMSYIEEIWEIVGTNKNYEFTEKLSQVNLDVDVSDLFNTIEYSPKVSFRNGIQQIISSLTHV